MLTAAPAIRGAGSERPLPARARRHQHPDIFERLAADDLPSELAVSAVSLAELSAGVHSSGEAVERARRTVRVQRVEATFSPLPFDAEAARQYGIIAAEVISVGRKPRGRIADLMIASIAAANRLPLFTTNPADFHGLESVVTVVPVPVPA